MQADSYSELRKRRELFILFPNIPPMSIHLCCSNMRHKMSYKAY